ncbi:MAG: cell division protein FtsB [Chromatiales bacterium]|jgi:cell division protein FtsB|nr:cell division protein FtsB [Chromatiales bacterium]MDX9767948.1 cell division protein FtsB [Ectothiorhodospiraceae bacterium]
MNWLAALLAVLTLILQFKLWAGEGSLAEAWRFRQAVEAQRAENDQLRVRNQALEAEVLDLKTGLAAIEDRARGELGMVREGEVFFQIVDLSRRDQKSNP